MIPRETIDRGTVAAIIRRRAALFEESERQRKDAELDAKLRAVFDTMGPPELRERLHKALDEAAARRGTPLPATRQVITVVRRVRRVATPAYRPTPDEISAACEQFRRQRPRSPVGCRVELAPWTAPVVSLVT